jgi:hypothetical protein
MKHGWQSSRYFGIVPEKYDPLQFGYGRQAVWNHLIRLLGKGRATHVEEKTAD